MDIKNGFFKLTIANQPCFFNSIVYLKCQYVFFFGLCISYVEFGVYMKEKEGKLIESNNNNK